MQLEVQHRIEYVFSRPVFLEPHTLRLHPRVDGSQSLADFVLSIDPEPNGLCESIDAEGNAVSIVWFSGLHASLRIAAQSVVLLRRGNPFSYLIAADRSELPMSYAPCDELLLQAARTRTPVAAARDDVRDFVERLAAEAEHQVLSFLWKLNSALRQDWESVRREDGAPQSAAETFATRTGACRDLALLFMDACRCVGIAARFVSGYQHQSESAPLDLHAWAEVYIPGGGWRGYDPSQGLAIADEHVVVAAACRPEGAAPVAGSFRGTSATAAMRHGVDICVAAGSAAQSMTQG